MKDASPSAAKAIYEAVKQCRPSTNTEGMPLLNNYHIFNLLLQLFFFFLTYFVIHTDSPYLQFSYREAVGDSQNLAKVKVKEIHCSAFIHKFSHFICKGNSVGHFR